MGRQKRMMPERFTPVYIADVYLDDRGGNSRHGIGQGDGGVGERAGIEHNPVGAETCHMEFIEQGAFVVALKIVELELRKSGFQVLKKRFKALAAINFRLARSKQVEIGAIDKEDFHECKKSSKFGMSENY